MATSAVSDAVRSINMQSLLKIITTQLTHQNPLEPTKDADFIAQMAQFASLAQTQEMNTQMAQLLAVQSATQSVGLLGKQVDFQKLNGDPASGVVTALAFSNGVPTLSITTGSGLELGVTFGQLVRVQQ